MAIRIISLINQKGGSGKTTTCVNLGAYLAKFGKKVLLIDIDPQANSSIHLGVKLKDLKTSLYEVLVSGLPINSVTLQTEIENLRLVPSHINLSGAEIELVNVIGRETILKDRLEKIKYEYDYILIDCPPSLGILTLNALSTSKEVIIPIQTQFLALEGMSKLISTINIVQSRINSELKLTGIVATMYDSRTNLSEEVLEKIKEHFSDKIFKTKIRQNIKLAEAPSFGKSILSYAATSHGADDYQALAKEVIKMESKNA